MWYPVINLSITLFFLSFKLNSFSLYDIYAVNFKEIFFKSCSISYRTGNIPIISRR